MKSNSNLFILQKLNNFERTVMGIQGCLDAYRFAVANTQLNGPTNFAPTIREFVNKCKQFPRNGTKYQAIEFSFLIYYRFSINSSFQVLLILTDGIITDMQQTMEAIIEASHQPISIISSPILFILKIYSFFLILLNYVVKLAFYHI
jgi:hypothetical protein